jgi:hypothetical protein
VGYARKGATNTNCAYKNQQPKQTMSLNANKIMLAVENCPDFSNKNLTRAKAESNQERV